MVMEVLSEGVLQPKLMDEEVEKATNKSNIINFIQKTFCSDYYIEVRYLKVPLY